MRKFLLAISILVSGIGTVSAQQAAHVNESDPEKFVLEKLKNGEPADFANEPQNQLSSQFIVKLLTNSDDELDIRQHLVTIDHAVIKGDIGLLNEEVGNDIALTNCTFEDDVNFTQTHFKRSLDFTGSVFKKKLDLENVIIDYSFKIDKCQFTFQDPKDPDNGSAYFGNVRVGRDLSMTPYVQFVGSADFTQSNIAGKLLAEGVVFQSGVEFDSMTVGSETILRNAHFNGGQAGFGNTHFTNLFLNNADFKGATAMDFEMMQVDNIFLDGVAYPPSAAAVNLSGMTFRSMSPASWDRLKDLRSHSAYDIEFFTGLETLFRSHGHTSEADQIFIEMQRHNRRESCKSLRHDCGEFSGRVRWLGSVLEDLLTGYGRSLENLLLWSIGFVLLGTIVFRRTAMRRADHVTHDAEARRSFWLWRTRRWIRGLMGGFWYSLDLFLPVIELGERDKWVPKDNRRCALLYKKLHAIIGHLFVPIGLAAWTGIIK